MLKSLEIYIPIHCHSESLDVQKRLFELGYRTPHGPLYTQQDCLEYTPELCFTLWNDGDITLARVSEVNDKYKYCYIGNVPPYKKPNQYECPIRTMMIHELGEETTNKIYDRYSDKIEQQRNLGISNQNIFADIVRDHRTQQVLEIMKGSSIKELSRADELFLLYRSSIELALEKMSPLQIVSRILKIEEQIVSPRYHFKIKGCFAAREGYFVMAGSSQYLHSDGEIRSSAINGSIRSGWFRSGGYAEQIIKEFFPTSTFEHVWS